jgi:hypothetical protein
MGTDMEQKPQAWTYSEYAEKRLSTRTVNVLLRFGLEKRDDVLRAVKDGTLHPSNIAALGFGRKALAEVRAALGLKPEITNREIFRARCRAAAALSAQGFKLHEIAKILRLGTKVQAMRHVMAWKRVEKNSGSRRTG